MKRKQNRMEQIPFAVLVKDIAHDPAYQPTIPLMRLIKEEYCGVFEECDVNVTSTMSSVDQNIGLQSPDDQITQPVVIYIKEEYVNNWPSIEASDPGENQLSGISSAEPYDVNSLTEQKTMTNDLPTIKKETESDFEDVPGTEGSSLVVSDGHHFKHIFKVEEDELSTDAGSISKESVESTVKSETMDRKIHKCTICSKEFIKNNQLKIHLRIHTGEKPYECSVCKKAFTQSDHLKSHLRTHTGEKPYECTICKNAFTRIHHLKNHLRTHTGEKPYECSVCKRAYTRLGDLKKHMRTHTGEKPYECSVCKKAFTQSDHLKGHLRTHTGEKPYECSVCKNAFTRAEYLKRHMRTHTGEKPYECGVCRNAFANLGNFKIHLRIHTGEKPYKCSVCNKAFNRGMSLKRHMQIHTDKSPRR